jgi:hypothetical protein
MSSSGSPCADEELREFLLVLRRALLVIVRWIEKRYCVDPTE